MVMIPKAQCAVDCSDSAANSAADDCPDRSRGSIAPVRAFFCASDQALGLHCDGQAHEDDKSGESDMARLHFFPDSSIGKRDLF